MTDQSRYWLVASAITFRICFLAAVYGTIIIRVLPRISDDRLGWAAVVGLVATHSIGEIAGWVAKSQASASRSPSGLGTTKPL